MLTGVRGDLAIDIFGSDNDELEKIAVKIKAILESIPGSSDVYKKANDGVEYFELTFDKKMMGFYGISQEEINRFLKVMLTGESAGIIQEQMRRIPLMVKGGKDIHNSLDKLQRLYYPLSDGTSVPLSNFVHFTPSSGPVQIGHENGYRKTIVQSNVNGRDLVSFVEVV